MSVSDAALAAVSASPQTLPALLAHQAQLRPNAIALRHKRLGIWQTWTWRELLSQTQRYRTGLAAQGINANSRLLLLSRPRVEALLLSLAAQSLGAVVAPLDPELERSELHALLALIQPDVAFAEAQAEVDILLASGSSHGYSPTLILYGDGRGLGSYALPQLQSLPTLLDGITRATEHHDWRSIVSAERYAFVFYGRDSSGLLIQQAFSHQRLIIESQSLIKNAQLSARDEALAARAFATAGQARYLLAPWLIVGLRLNFPENLATRDHDRRELAPTLVLGSKTTYARVAELAAQKLPSHGSLSRRLYDWTHRAHLRNPLAWLLVQIYRRSLRENLGFARLRTALLIGEPLGKAHTQFYQSLGIDIRRLASAGVTAEINIPDAEQESDLDTAKVLAGVADTVKTETAPSTETHAQPSAASSY